MLVPLNYYCEPKELNIILQGTGGVELSDTSTDSIVTRLLVGYCEDFVSLTN
jgi:hypothetical protein